MTEIRPYSNAAKLAKLDGRTKEARLIKCLREQLKQHVGGAPSATQMMLIEQAAQLQLRIALMDRKVIEGRQMTEHDGRVYLAWANSLARLVRQLGMKGATKSAPSLQDHLAKRRHVP